MTSDRYLSAIVAAIAFVAATIPSTGATSTNEPPTTLSGSGAENHWVTFKIDAPHVSASIRLTVFEMGRPAVFGSAQYDENARFKNSFTFSTPGGPDGVLVNSTPPTGDPVHMEFRGGNESEGTRGITININAVPWDQRTDYKGYIVLWIVGSFGGYSWITNAESGANVTVDEGDEAYYFSTPDFRGTLTAQAYEANLGGRALVNTGLELSFARVFIGTWQKLDASMDHMTYDGPEGQKICTGPTPGGIGTAARCSWWYVADDPGGDSPLGHKFAGDRGDPGYYRFSLTGVGAGLQGLDGVYLWAAMPRFPGLDTSV